MARWLGTCVALAALASSGCGSSEEREPFDSVDDAGVVEAGGSIATDGGSVDLCEPTALAERRSLAGCAFVMTPPAYSEVLPNIVLGGCYALLVSNPSSVPAHLRLRFKGQGDDEAREEDGGPYARRAIVDGRRIRYEPLTENALGPHETAVVSAVFLPAIAGGPALPEAMPTLCPTKAFVETASDLTFEVGARDALIVPGVELLADVPVLAAQVSQYVLDGDQVAASGQTPFALFPIQLWEKQPVETGIFQPRIPDILWCTDERGNKIPFETLPMHTFAIAAFDDTHVTLPTSEGPPVEVTLQRGEVFSHTTNDALSGRPGSADKPVALLSYAPKTLVPWDFEHLLSWPDARRSSSMAMPSSLWGFEYVAVRHGDRWEGLAEAPAWRILGGADGTKLTYEPYRPTGAPETIAKGELAVFFADEPFVVRSQDESHTFYFSESMTGSNYQRERHGYLEPRDDWRGGALTVHQLATSHWKNAYPLFAPVDFPEHSLVIVRPRGGADVRLDCAGTLTGWQPVGERYEFVRVALTGHLYEPIVYPAGTCQGGPHWIESDGPFSGTLWGWGNLETWQVLKHPSYAAYALPLFGADVPIPPPTK